MASQDMRRFEQGGLCVRTLITVEFLTDHSREGRMDHRLPWCIQDELAEPAGPNSLTKFVAQLAASYLQLPQTRARWRAAQSEASSAYGATCQLRGGQLGLDRRA
jgi:hypothetical protein